MTQELRLKNINEIRNYFLQNELMSKQHKNLY